MLYVATKGLAEFTDDRKIERGFIYPKITDIRAVSQEVAIKVIQCAYREGNNFILKKVYVNMVIILFNNSSSYSIS